MLWSDCARRSWIHQREKSIIIIIIIIIESYTEYNKKLKIQKYKKKMHKTHSYRQDNSVNYLKLEQTAVMQLIIKLSVHSRCIIPEHDYSRVSCFTCGLQQVYAYMNVTFWPVATMSHLASVWTVTVVTLHRYIAVCFPHHTVKFANLRVARLQASFRL